MVEAIHAYSGPRAEALLATVGARVAVEPVLMAEGTDGVGGSASFLAAKIPTTGSASLIRTVRAAACLVARMRISHDGNVFRSQIVRYVAALGVDLDHFTGWYAHVCCWSVVRFGFGCTGLVDGVSSHRFLYTIFRVVETLCVVRLQEVLQVVLIVLNFFIQ